MRDVQSRVAWLLGLLAAGLLLMVFQLYRLTISQAASWRVQAEAQIWRELPSYGPRGSIYDRKGRSLATSEPAFAAILVDQTPQHVEQILPKLANLLAPGDPQRARDIVNHVWKRVHDHRESQHQFEPITIARKLDWHVVSTLMERRSEFPGIAVVTEAVRSYPQGSLAGAVFGYVGPISADELASPEFRGYHADEIVGKNGLELFYEQHLHGRPGKRSVIVDPYGRPMSDMSETPPAPGNNLHLTLDLDLQRVAEEALARQMDWIRRQNDPEARPTRGAVVVQDVRTGAILAMASLPTYDPNLFVAGMTEAQWEALVSDPGLPMQNWAIAGYAPGSTYKMAVGLAGLESGVLGPYQRIDCQPVYWRYHQPKNWYPVPQGLADVARSLAISCDPYFYEVGYLMGIDAMAAFMEYFGFGRPTGIDLPAEQPGLNPTIASYGDRWTPGQVLSVAIGQGDVLTTPLQLAEYTATLANGGTRYRPYLVEEIRQPDGEVVLRRQPEELGRLPVKGDHLRRVQEGMRLTVTSSEGTAHRAFAGFPVAVAAKTGSAETGHAWANALTVAYAPYDAPQIAIAVVVEGGAHGSWVAPVARDVMAHFFGVPEEHNPGLVIKAD